MTLSGYLIFFCLIHGALQLLDNTEIFWTANPLTGIHYQINPSSFLTWHKARSSCLQQNAELVSITEIHDQAFLKELTKNLSSTLWIGLNALDSNNRWQWIGRNPYRYLNWAPGNPVPAPEKSCAVLNPRKEAKWENMDCDYKFGYICKKENSTPEFPSLPTETFQPIKCQDSWSSYRGHCYKIQREPQEWKEALALCKKEDGDLASIHNVAEYSFIISQLGYKPTEELWIGLNDLKVHQYFEWSDETPVTYTKWLRGEPAYAKSLEDCVLIKGQEGFWAATVCEKKRGYICKRKPLLQAPEEVEMNDLGCQRGWKRHGFHCYLVGHTFLKFSEASEACQRSYGYLVTVEDRNEQAYLTSLVGLSPEKYFWIGLSDVEEQGTFKWANGEVVLFTHWNSGMPGREPGCVAMGTGIAGGLWDVLNCEKAAKFLCKQWAEGVTPPLIAATVSDAPCPGGWELAPYTSFCFKFFIRVGNQRKTWFEAEEFCREIGGNLLSIHSREEQFLIWKLALDEGFFFQPFWIGLFHLNPDDGYFWIDGSPVVYENWNEGEPSNDKGIEHCIMFEGSTGMQWNATYCEHLLNWICEIKKGASLKPEPSTIFEYEVSDDEWVKHEDKWYYFSIESTYMEKAQEMCRKNFADLVVIDSESEQKFLWRYIHYKNRMDSYFIGLSGSLDQKFSWMSGTPVNYVAWAPNEPSFGNEKCVVMHKDFGFWSKINCGIRNAFICERHNSSAHSGVAPTASSPQGGCLETWLLFNNQCYKILGANEEERLSWHLARNACIELRGNLASIHNEQVQAFLTLHIKDMSETWIGLIDINTEQDYLWTDGSVFDYSKWAQGFTFKNDISDSYWGDRIYLNQESACIAMMKRSVEETGYWGSAGCQHKKSYVCQMDSKPELFYSPKVPVSDLIHYDNSTYSVIHSKTNWGEAQKTCREKSAELASVVDIYSALFLWIQILQFGEPVWIGLNSNVTDGYYKWTDNRRLKYAKWAHGEPKASIACVYLDLDGAWKTASCDKKYFSVCKWSDVTVPTDPPQLPGKCPESNDDQSWIPFHGHCYMFNTDEIKWSEASVQCLQLGATLASIEDLAESNFLTVSIEPLADKTSGFWAGIYRNMDGGWLWLDNAAVDFVNWNKGEPSSNRSDYCVEISASSGYWNTIPCSSKKKSVCKKAKTVDIASIKNLANGKEDKMDEEPVQRRIWILIILVLLIFIGVGIMINNLFKIKRLNQLQMNVRSSSILLEHSGAITEI